MTKTKSNASWNQLTPKQREKLDRWLFEENLSYAAILIKASRELGYKGSESSLRRYYERRRQERLLTDLKEVGKDMMEVRELDASPDLSRKASMQMLGAYLFRVLRAAPEKVKEWAPVANLLVRNDYNEILREAKAREHQIREKAMAFAREKFELDVTEQALKALPQLRELAQARKHPQTKRYEEYARLNRIRRMMFGAGEEVHPENAQEEAEMLAAKREREAEPEQEPETQAEQITEPGPPPPSSPYYEEYLEAKAEEEAEEREREKALRQSQAQAARAGRAEQKESTAHNEAQATEAKKAEEEKLRKQQEKQARFEELRELCGWQEVEWPPGWEGGTGNVE